MEWLPSWQVDMMNDTERNAAYARALEWGIARIVAKRGESVEPLTVLDLGCGAGLFSSQRGQRDTSFKKNSPLAWPTTNRPRVSKSDVRVLKKNIKKKETKHRLSLLAVRACEQAGVSSAAVHACEASPGLARLAVRSCAANGSVVAVHAAWSSELEVGLQLPHRADVCVHEILSSNLVGEGVLRSMNDAWENLLAPAFENG